jgi:hypothetical protein
LMGRLRSRDLGHRTSSLTGHMAPSPTPAAGQLVAQPSLLFVGARSSPPRPFPGTAPASTGHIDSRDSRKGNVPGSAPVTGAGPRPDFPSPPTAALWRRRPGTTSEGYSVVTPPSTCCPSQLRTTPTLAAGWLRTIARTTTTINKPTRCHANRGRSSRGTAAPAYWSRTCRCLRDGRRYGLRESRTRSMGRWRGVESRSSASPAWSITDT